MSLLRSSGAGLIGLQTAWHTGHSLAQTVYTCLYVHELGVGRLWNGNRINTRILQMPQDPSRPLQLITLVLRASVYGLLKSCDLAWREMTKGHVLEVRWLSQWNALSVPVDGRFQRRQVRTLLVRDDFRLGNHGDVGRRKDVAPLQTM